MDELLHEFLVESFENLDQLDQDLLALERDPANRDALTSIFRTIHTIKGTCGFLGFSKLESITHVGENLLALLRDGRARFDHVIADGLLAMCDAVRAILAEIETTQAEGDTDYSTVVAMLAALEQQAAQPAVESADDSEAPVGARFGELLVQQGAATEVDVAIGLIRQREAGDGRRIGEILQDAGAVESDAINAAAELQRDIKRQVADSTLRVDVNVLDELVTLVGELVLARNHIVQIAAASQLEPALVTTTQRLNTITTELQAGVMKTRMQPIGNVWSKFPRVVRDMAAACGKQVRIEMDGKQTELDKTIIEAIKDPLTHLIRNSIDHGIESPELRASRGKPAEGLVLLRAYHEGGEVVIEITDDGGGIDVERVKATAISRGLIDAAHAERMADREAVNLIFVPGFSTAENVSNISGRGVGMDVVKTNIERIGGTIDMQNRPGGGTTLKIKIPLTLAIIPALVATSGGDHYAIPQVNLLELVGLDSDEAQQAIEHVQDAPVYRLRGRILPLLYLDEQLAGEPGERTSATIVVLRAEEHEFGLVVDRVNDTEEIVVKPLSAQLDGVAAFSGCTIMGDGRVALILDVAALARRAGIIGDSGAPGAIESARPEDAAAGVSAMLVVVAGGDGRVAIPLSQVDRLEEFPSASVERASGRRVVQYRDSIMALVDLGEALGRAPSLDAERANLQVVVSNCGSRPVGLVVDRIVDIVRQRVAIEQYSSARGTVASAVIDGAATDVLDVVQLVAATDPDLCRTETASPANTEPSYSV